MSFIYFGHRPSIGILNLYYIFESTRQSKYDICYIDSILYLMFSSLNMFDRDAKAKQKTRGERVTLKDSSLNAIFISFCAPKM